MKAKYLGKTVNLVLTNGKIYDVLGEQDGFIRVVDDTGDDYLYDPISFEIIP